MNREAIPWIGCPDVYPKVGQGRIVMGDWFMFEVFSGISATDFQILQPSSMKHLMTFIEFIHSGIYSLSRIPSYIIPRGGTRGLPITVLVGVHCALLNQIKQKSAASV